jgi:hypothetical protein
MTTLMTYGVGIATSQSRPTGQVPMKVTYVQLYPGRDGETHFRDVSVPLTLEAVAPPAPAYALSPLEPATSSRHVIFPAHWGADDRDRGILHNASSRRYIAVRSGTMWIKASDGETRQFKAGDVLQVLDVAPSKGHTTWVGNDPVVALYSNHP